MITNLFCLEFIRFKRTFTPIELIPILLLLCYVVSLLKIYISKYGVEINNDVLLQMTVSFALFDLFMKYIFQKRQVVFPMYINVSPISVRSKYLFELCDSVFNFWNFYGLLVWAPILVGVHDMGLVVSVLLFVLAISFTNCFVIRVFDKSQNVLLRISTLVYLTYYIYILFASDKYSISFRSAIPLQILFLVVSVCASLKMKCYAEQQEASSVSFSSHGIPSYSMELLPVLRSKRIYIPMLLFIPYMTYVMYNVDVTADYILRLVLLFFSLCSHGLYSQLNFGIEANYWQIFDVTPKGVSSMLERKFNFFFVFELIIMAIYVPLIYYRGISLLYFVSVFLVSAVFYNMTQLLNFVFINKFDMWSSPFFNSQGSNVLSVIFQLIPAVMIIGISVLCEYNDCLVCECIIFIVLGIACFVAKRRIFDLFYKIYRMKRYDIINRFVD